MIQQADTIAWPTRFDLMGVEVSATDYACVVDRLTEAARIGHPAIATFHPVYGIVWSSGDERLRQRVNSFEIVAADGQPIRWALNLLHRAGMTDRVYGPETMLRVCERAAAEGLPIYLYGGASEDVLRDLEAKLLEKFPQLVIAGGEVPPFRPLTEEEDAAVVERINASGARFVFIGLGCPKQDHFAYEHRDRLQAVQLCVGAAFDFHAGRKKMAPRWMQKRGLEWLFRLGCEPRRLGMRYLTTNSVFIWKFLRQWLTRPRRGAEPGQRL